VVKPVRETHEGARSSQLRVLAFLELVLLKPCLRMKATLINPSLRGSSLVKATYLLFLH